MAEGGRPPKYDESFIQPDSAYNSTLSTAVPDSAHNTEFGIENDLDFWDVNGPSASSPRQSSLDNYRETPQPVSEVRALDEEIGQPDPGAAQAGVSASTARGSTRHNLQRDALPEYATFDRRFATYLDKNDRARRLCRAGFYLTAPDMVRCFRCHAGFSINQQELSGDQSSLWDFHASLMPVCRFVIEQQGVDYVLEQNTLLTADQRQVLENTRAAAPRPAPADEVLPEDFLIRFASMETKVQNLTRLHIGLERSDMEQKVEIDDLKEKTEETAQNFQSLGSNVSELNSSTAETQRQLSYQGEVIQGINRMHQETNVEHRHRHDDLQATVEDNHDDMMRRTNELQSEQRHSEHELRGEQHVMQENLRGNMIIQNQHKNRLDDLEMENNININHDED